MNVKIALMQKKCLGSHFEIWPTWEYKLLVTPFLTTIFPFFSSPSSFLPTIIWIPISSFIFRPETGWEWKRMLEPILFLPNSSGLYPLWQVRIQQSPDHFPGKISRIRSDEKKLIHRPCSLFRWWLLTLVKAIREWTEVTANTAALLFPLPFARKGWPPSYQTRIRHYGLVSLFQVTRNIWPQSPLTVM